MVCRRIARINLQLDTKTKKSFRSTKAKMVRLLNLFICMVHIEQLQNVKL